jgi:hypothetical protein
MDCARVSTNEINNLKFIGKYKKLPTAQTVLDCKQACVSDLNCKAWSFRTLGFTNDRRKSLFRKNNTECLLSDTLIPTKDHIIEPSPLTKSGLVECKKIPEYAKIILWLGLAAVILFIVWYFLNIFEPERFKLHENMIPTFFFKSGDE